MPLTPGDDLEPLMAASGFIATQTAVDAIRVNLYVVEMTSGNWRWLPLNRRNPILIDELGKIMSGHHRLIAARIAEVIVPAGAVQRFPGITQRPATAWHDILVC